MKYDLYLSFGTACFFLAVKIFPWHSQMSIFHEWNSSEPLDGTVNWLMGMECNPS